MECDVPSGGGVGMCNVSLRCLGILRQSVLGPVFSQLCAWVWSMCVWGPKEPRLPRILHSCLDVLWHSRPTAVFCFPGPRAYFERHSHGQHNRSTLSLSHTHSSTTHTYILAPPSHSISNMGEGMCISGTCTWYYLYIWFIYYVPT